jgi:rare lipoprotein A
VRSAITYCFLSLSIIALLYFSGCSSGKVFQNDGPISEYPGLPVLAEDDGIASYYNNKFEGRKTASGERYKKHLMTAAHRSYPFGTFVRVRSTLTGKSVVVRINDRGPRSDNRIIDVSRAAALQLGILKDGIAMVKLEVVDWGGGLAKNE